MARYEREKYLQQSRGEGERRRPANSPGYEKGGKERFDYKVRYTVDYRDYEKSLKSINETLSDRLAGSKSLRKDLRVPMKGAGSKSFHIDITNNILKSKFSKKINDNIITKVFPGGYEMSMALQAPIQGLGKKGKDIMLKYVRRKDTGLMIREVKYEARKRNGYTTLEIGWIRYWVKYFGFQEMGFYSGYPSPRGHTGGAPRIKGNTKVTGMRSLLRTRLEFNPIFQREINTAVRKILKAK